MRYVTIIIFKSDFHFKNLKFNFSLVRKEKLWYKVLGTKEHRGVIKNLGKEAVEHALKNRKGIRKCVGDDK